MAMLRRPPQHALLRRRLRAEGQHELKHPPGAVGAMREVAVIAGADAENAQPVERRAKRDGLDRHAGPERGEAREVHQHERNGRRIHDVVVFDGGWGRGGSGRGGLGRGGKLRFAHVFACERFFACERLTACEGFMRTIEPYHDYELEKESREPTSQPRDFQPNYSADCSGANSFLGQFLGRHPAIYMARRLSAAVLPVRRSVTIS